MKVILIDDDSTSNSLNKMLLHYYNETFQVTSFSSALLALNYIDDHSDCTFELIFIDLEMRDLDGWQTVEVLQNSETCCPNIVILTAYLTENEIETSKRYSNVKSIIKKPLTLAKIDKLMKLI